MFEQYASPNDGNVVKYESCKPLINFQSRKMTPIGLNKQDVNTYTSNDSTVKDISDNDKKILDLQVYIERLEDNLKES